MGLIEFATTYLDRNDALWRSGGQPTTRRDHPARDLSKLWVAAFLDSKRVTRQWWNESPDRSARVHRRDETAPSCAQYWHLDESGEAEANRHKGLESTINSPHSPAISCGRVHRPARRSEIASMQSSRNLGPSSGETAPAVNSHRFGPKRRSRFSSR